MHRESKISVNLVPGAFPLKKWVGRKRLWHGWSLVFIKIIFIWTLMYEFLWTILHPHWLTAFQKNTLVYCWFVINFPGRWRKSPRETRNSGCVERAKFWKLTGIHGGRSTPKKVHPRNLIFRLCCDALLSLTLLQGLYFWGKSPGNKVGISGVQSL